MARSAEQLASHRAAAMKSYNLNKDATLKRRFMLRIASGKTTRIGMSSLEKYGMTMQEINEIRRCNGLGALRSPLDPAPPCRNAPQGNAEPPPTPQGNPETAPAPRRSSRKRARQDSALPSGSHAGTHDDEAGPSGHAGQPVYGPDVSEKFVLDKMQATAGVQKLDKYMRPMFLDNGAPDLMSEGAANDYRKKLAQLFNKEYMHPGGAAERFRDAQKFIDFVIGRWVKPSSAKQYLNCVVSAGKYIPEFRAALGPAFDDIREANVDGIVRATKYAIDKTATARVIPFPTLEGRLAEA